MYQYITGKPSAKIPGIKATGLDPYVGIKNKYHIIM